jgi:excisionase family DNA binding protein
MNTQATTEAPSDTLTTREVAHKLGLAVRSVQLMVDRGELRAWKTSGGHRRILAQSVQDWLTRSPNALSGGIPAEPPKTTFNSRRRNSDTGKVTVLVIEDSVHFQRVLSLLIQNCQADVALHLANDAAVGLALCGAVRPDIIIVDLLLPGIDGAALITSLRSQPYFEGMQLMVVTALDAKEREPFAYALTGIPVIEKKDLTQRFTSELTALLDRIKDAD